MATMWQQVVDLGLTPLIAQTRLQVTLTFPGPGEGPQGAYITHTATHVTVTTDASADTVALTDQLAALLASMPATALSVPQVTVALQLPEGLFERLYATGASAAQVDYLTFRNTLYRQLAVATAQHRDALAGAWGSQAARPEVALQQVPGHGARPIAALRVGQLAALAGATGVTPAALTWLQALPWFMMTAPSGGLVAGMAAWGVAAPVMTLASGAPTALAVDPLVAPLPGAAALSRETQLLLIAAYRTGLRVRVLDADQELIELTDGARVEVVQGGSLTALDPAVAIALTDRKQAQKMRLGAAGLPLSRGTVYHTWAAAQADFKQGLAHKSLVVKPNAGHDGQGVSVFPLPPTAAAFAHAFDVAATFGDVLVELFAPGTVVRCVVVAGRVVAALECEPPSLVGDGRQTIAALAQRRGVSLDADAVATLAAQGADEATVPLRGHEVRLRGHARVTDGTTIDVTDELDDSYRNLALAAATALGVQVAAVDMVLVNRYQPWTAEHPELAKVLSVSLQPRMAPHLTPTIGSPRAVAPSVVAALFGPTTQKKPET
ncbi:hypothetical protein [Lacticaseibacillus absianus]|uniref:hypothetical protein n=1 Tax=Lacticaseibacillus absianus TaxID=2729623 RepID=UPI0015CA8493|nr:hypothetical protein [Lacticaseibacillus absianus]